MKESTLPEYDGLESLGGSLPAEREPWPKFSTRRTLDASGDFYDLAQEEIAEYAEGKPWVWPQRPLFFLTDMHADADAFLRSLVATGGVKKTGPGDDEFELTPSGREALFIIGGDCFDKGPSNLRLLRSLAMLRDKGAHVDILAGNHDVRALVGLEYMGRKETWLAHLFVRMGKKSIPLFKEIHDTYLAGGDGSAPQRDENQLRAMLFPEASWYQDFPAAVRGLVPEKRVQRELVRIREKVQELEEARQDVGLSLGMIYGAALKAKELLRDPAGEFSWFFREMNLTRREGSLLFIHAGVDDVVARQLARDGVQALNERFRRLMEENLFELYHGPVGNTFRTKYRDSDMSFTSEGLRHLHQAGILAIVHGHRNIPRGQRLVLRNGLLNFECDTTVDINTRQLLGLQGVGGSATIVSPDGTVTGISTDYAYAKSFDIRAFAGITMLDPGRTGENGSRKGELIMEKTAEKNENVKDTEQGTVENNGKAEVKFENTLPLSEAVSYFEAIVAGFKKGSINLRRGDKDVTLTPSSNVVVEVKAVRKKKKEGISFEIFWRVPEKELSISSK
jgi:amphi-Trp domain-containing protein